MKSKICPHCGEHFREITTCKCNSEYCPLVTVEDYFGDKKIEMERISKVISRGIRKAASAP